MADQLRPKAVFPAPPPFYKHFTGEDDISEDAKQYLVPPPLPSDGKYHSFGVLHDVGFHVTFKSLSTDNHRTALAARYIPRRFWHPAALPFSVQ